MEVILLENIRRLGKIGDTVKIKDGYGRNFLLPRGKALRANEANKQVFDARRAEIEKENAERLKEAQKLSTKLEGLIIPMVRQAGEDGRLFGSVTANDIAKAIQEIKKVEISRSQISLTAPIKNIGIQPVALNLHSELALEVHVNIAQTEGEIEDNKARFLRGEYTGPKTRKNEDEDDNAKAAEAAFKKSAAEEETAAASEDEAAA